VTGGRQALGLIAARLTAEGRRGVLVPDHHCESMTDPFTRHGLAVVSVPTTLECLLDADALDCALTAHPGHPVLHSETRHPRRS
jgi:aspartate/methionine/tyrosine aminotransferase